MFGFDTIDVAIGVCLIFLLTSLIATAVQEALEGMMKLRAMDLANGIRELLNDQKGNGIAADFFKHPLVYSLFSGDYNPSKWRNLPSYIPAGNFAGAVFDILARGKPSDETSAVAPPKLPTMDELRVAVKDLPNEHLKRAVLAAIDQAQGDLDAVKKNLEAWYDSAMDRVSGWYKRRTQLFLFLIGLVMAIGLNIDAIHVVDRLTQDKSLRQAVVAQAGKLNPAENGKLDPDALIALQKKSFHELRDQLSSAGLPVGWKTGWPPEQLTCSVPDVPVGSTKTCPNSGSLGWAFMIVGWLITAFAVMLGAPFWFDALNKIMVIRSTVKPHEKSPEEPSADRR